jgi:amidase
VWGATGNPFNPNLNAGGSSGGSAAALACDMLPVCTGSDTGGSLRIPAAKCGVVGFRPSPGIVPSVRKPLGWTPISVVGPMGRTVEDACLQMAASAGMHAGDPLSYPLDPLSVPEARALDLAGLRVAWTEDFGTCAVDDGIRATFREKIAAMRHLFAAATRSISTWARRTAASTCCAPKPSWPACRHLRTRPGQPGAQPARELRDGRAHEPARQRLGAGRADAAHPERFQATFADYDLVLSPTTPVSPFPWTQLTPTTSTASSKPTTTAGWRSPMSSR